MDIPSLDALRILRGKITQAQTVEASLCPCRLKEHVYAIPEVPGELPASFGSCSGTRSSVQ